MRIERILLRDVGPFDDVTIEFPKGSDPKLADVYLLTGPNGTGKSTVLYALATLIGTGYDRLGASLIERRLRSPNALVAMDNDRETMVCTYGRSPPSATVREPFHQLNLLYIGSRGRLAFHSDVLTFDRYAELATNFDPKDPFEQRTFEWAAFAYASVRSMTDVRITAIQAPKESPFTKSLSFTDSADSAQLANWIANQNFRRLKAKEAGNHERAAQLDQSVRDIEQVIADIVEEPRFRFVLQEQDDDVRVCWHGNILRFDMLPDGLKSIVSWIADLLMRLERIPWRNDVPVMERPFLLLLDEVDIHLHPAWQRKVLPLVQRAFPNAQIIASTHSPFVVGSVADAKIITLALRGSSSVVEQVSDPQIGVSQSAVLRSIFGIESEFDVDTEAELQKFHAAKQKLLGGDAAMRVEVDRLARELSARSEELRELIALEMGQLRRQLAVRAAP